MNGKHVFYAGPCLLPDKVYREVQEAVGNFADTGVSVMSISHRSSEWGAVMDETRVLWRELLNIPDDYEILLLAGGASMEFLRVPMNLLERKAAYLDTGIWAHKAFKEASGIGNAVEVASSSDLNYSYIPEEFTIPEDADYFHVTSCNTVYGTQLGRNIESPVPVVADMSSDILSRPVDVSRYSLIYGGAQKNAGTAGANFVIVRRDCLGKVTRHIPTLLNYQEFIDRKSMSNTPPVLPIYVMNRMLHWIKEQGGVDVMFRRNKEKAETLYKEIDRNTLFRGTAREKDRSMMNACFVMAPGFESLEEEFLSFAASRDIVGIKGHRFAGGFRASIYNACTQEDVEALTSCMKEFEELHK